MSGVPKKKLCWNCEGSVMLEADNCPYCGVYLHPVGQEEKTTIKENRLQEEETLKAPYQFVSSEEKQEVPLPPYNPQNTTSSSIHPFPTTSSSKIQPIENEASFYNNREKTAVVEQDSYGENEEKKANTEEIKKVLVPLVFLLSGSIFLLFSFMLLLFSSNGMFILKWKASYWMFYLILSMPLLYFGWKTLQSVDDSEENI